MLAEVLGRVWAERQVEGYAGRRLVLVRENSSGRRCVAVDLLDASAGMTVLIATDEAAAAASGLASTDAAVVALVSDWDREEGAEP